MEDKNFDFYQQENSVAAELREKEKAEVMPNELPTTRNDGSKIGHVVTPLHSSQPSAAGKSLAWENEEGELYSYPVARQNGFKFELPRNRFGRPFAVIYTPKGQEITKEFYEPDAAKIFCEDFAKAVEAVATAVRAEVEREKEEEIKKLRKEVASANKGAKTNAEVNRRMAESKVQMQKNHEEEVKRLRALLMRIQNELHCVSQANVALAWIDVALADTKEVPNAN
jgi:hypothetical protein